MFLMILNDSDYDDSQRVERNTQPEKLLLIINTART